MTGEMQPPSEDINAHIAHLQVVRAEAERISQEQADLVREAGEAVMRELTMYVGGLVLLTGRPSSYTYVESRHAKSDAPKLGWLPLAEDNREERRVKGTVSRLDATLVTISLHNPSYEEGTAVAYRFPVEDISYIVDVPSDDE